VLEAIYWPKYEEEARENPVYKVLCKSLFVNIFLSTLMHWKYLATSLQSSISVEIELLQITATHEQPFALI